MLDHSSQEDKPIYLRLQPDWSISDQGIAEWRGQKKTCDCGMGTGDYWNRTYSHHVLFEVRETKEASPPEVVL